MTAPHVAAPLILRIITRLNVGGPARQAVMLSKLLDGRGFRTEIVSGVEEPREGHIPTLGIPNTVIPSLKRTVNPLSDLAAARSLSKLIRKRRPLVLHTHMAKAGALGRMAAHRAGVPIVVHTFHGHVLENYFSPLTTRAFIQAERILARWSDALVAVSPTVRDGLLRLGIGEPSQWFVIPVGLNLGPYLAADMSPEEARSHLGITQAGPVVGFVGRLVPIKDARCFLEAASRVAEFRPDVDFVIAGDGEMRDSLETEARRRLPDRVRFLGWVSNLVALYQAIDVVVLTSRLEGTPTALVEASASGVPAVATDVGGVSDIVREGKTGLLAERGNAAAIADRVLQLLEDSDMRRLMGSEGRAWVRERFSVDRLADDLVGLYWELLSRKRVERV
jgi:glycosyltransferase involved in cell wall biosynthesis